MGGPVPARRHKRKSAREISLRAHLCDDWDLRQGGQVCQRGFVFPDKDVCKKSPCRTALLIIQLTIDRDKTPMELAPCSARRTTHRPFKNRDDRRGDNSSQRHEALDNCG